MRGRGVVGWLVGWLLLTACGGAEPTPTLVPTRTPTSTPTLTPAPSLTVVRPTSTPLATNFATWRTATLENGQSFDFRQEVKGSFTQGDLYYVGFDPRQGSACFVADNEGQVGGRDLGSWPLTALTERPLPRDRYSGQCIPVIRGHVYVYGLQGDDRLAIFGVVDVNLDGVTFEYVLRK